MTDLDRRIEMEKIITERAGMESQNAASQYHGGGPTYEENDFYDLCDRLDNLFPQPDMIIEHAEGLDNRGPGRVYRSADEVEGAALAKRKALKIVAIVDTFMTIRGDYPSQQEYDTAAKSLLDELEGIDADTDVS